MKKNLLLAKHRKLDYEPMLKKGYYMPTKKEVREMVDSVKVIAGEIKWLRHDIKVNGQQGLEAILAQHEIHNREADRKLTILEDCTQTLQAKRKLDKAMAEYLFHRPKIALLINFITSWKGIVLFIIIVLMIFGFIEYEDAKEIILKLKP